jgi:GWxTD domain-containing protein
MTTTRIVLLALTLAIAVTGGARAADDPLAERHREWLTLVEMLILDEEREAFLALDKEYQRDAFIQRFWQVRDPFPETGRNEFRDAWQSRAEAAEEEFGSLDGDRAQAMMLFGAP